MASRPKSGYSLKDGAKCPGTTTIINRWKESGGLIQWAWKRGVEFPDEPLYATRDSAGDEGKRAADLFDAHLKGEQPPPKPATMTEDQDTRATQACISMIEWMEQSKLTVRSVEVPFVSEKYGYGGTPDGDLESPKGLALGEWKSGAGIYYDMLLQMAAYDILIEENTGEKMTGGWHLVRFGKASARFTHIWIPADDPLVPVAKRQFLRLLDAYRDDKLLSTFRV